MIMPNKLVVRVILIAFISLSFFLTGASMGQARVETAETSEVFLEKHLYSPGETIRVHLKRPAQHYDAWVGMYAADSPLMLSARDTAIQSSGLNQLPDSNIPGYDLRYDIATYTPGKYVFVLFGDRGHANVIEITRAITVSGSAKEPGEVAAHAIPFQHGIKIGWEHTNPNNGYSLFRSESIDDRGLPMVSSPIPGNAFIDPNTNPGTKYYYTVRCGDSDRVIAHCYAKAKNSMQTSPGSRLVHKMHYRFSVLQVGNSSMIVDGQIATVDSSSSETSPYIEDGRTMVPVRAVVEATGGRVYWHPGGGKDDRKEDKIVLVVANRSVEVSPGSSIATVDGVDHDMGVSPIIKNGRTYLPLRAVSTLLGASVSWLPETKEVIIIYRGLVPTD